VCSIFGCYHLQPQAPAHPRFLEEARRLLRHRGPDQERNLDAGRAVLGHQRLSIVDLSEHAQQPMTADGCNLTYNGEIYNFPELRAASLDGVPLVSHGDSEVLLHLLRREDVRCLNRLNGMWAFAYYQKARQRLVLGRDRFGIKPLYYLIQDDVLYFSSEIKPLAMIQPARHRQLETYVDLVEHGAGDQGACTHLQGVFQVRRGHYLEVGPEGVVERAWYFGRDSTVDARDFRRHDDVVERTEELLTDALRICLRADVSVGITLSGGLDSATLYTLAAKRLGTPLEAFTLAKRTPALNEEEAARRLTQEHHGSLNIVQPDRFANLDHYRAVLNSLEFPNWPLGSAHGDRLYRRVAEHGHRVIIEGHGSDELLAGYAETMSHEARNALRAGRLRMAAVATGLYFSMVRPRGRDPGSPLARATWKRFAAEAKSPDHSLERMFGHTALPLELRTFDRLSMRHSVESRSPFLDYRFVEWCQAMPLHFKIAPIGSKAVLRWILKKHGKDYLARARRKRAFLAEHYRPGDFSEETLQHARACVDAFAVPGLDHLRSEAEQALREGRLPTNLALELSMIDQLYGMTT
jgi:asparagine synthase (glutamine-hydrolysing)